MKSHRINRKDNGLYAQIDNKKDELSIALKDRIKTVQEQIDNLNKADTNPQQKANSVVNFIDNNNSTVDTADVINSNNLPKVTEPDNNSFTTTANAYLSTTDNDITQVEREIERLNNNRDTVINSLNDGYKRTGMPDVINRLTDVKNKMELLKAERESIPLKNQITPNNTAEVQSSISKRNTSDYRVNAINMLTARAEANILSNNITASEDLYNKSVELKLLPIQEKLEVKKNYLENLLGRKDIIKNSILKRSLDKQKEDVKRQEETLKEYQDEKARIIKLALEASRNGATAEDRSKILNSKTFSEAIINAGEFSQSIEDRNYKDNQKMKNALALEKMANETRKTKLAENKLSYDKIDDARRSATDLYKFKNKRTSSQTSNSGVQKSHSGRVDFDKSRAYDVPDIERKDDRVLGLLSAPSILPKFPTRKQVEVQVRKTARVFGVPENLALAIAAKESSMGQNKNMYNGAYTGIFQTGKAAKEEISNDVGWRFYNNSVEGDIIAGIGYLAKRLKARNGNMEQAISDYNWGMGNTNKFIRGEKRMPEETLHYIDFVNSYLDKKNDKELKDSLVEEETQTTSKVSTSGETNEEDITALLASF